jgi:2-polyprenyl-3-methyl-5-hydroxy-6-metoxy-1,4-benzoquinol methylase
MLLPDRLRIVWEDADRGRRTREQAAHEQERLLGEYRATWTRALLYGNETDLRSSLLREVATYYGIADLAEVERRCTSAVETMRDEWHEHVDAQRSESIESFYDSATYIYDLMGWHSLRDDNGPLAYVLGLEIAQEWGVKQCLDFGSGVGSGALLFDRAEIEVSLADISTTLLDFARWRLAQRERVAHFYHLQQTVLPSERFDMILAMDVFEHLADPVTTVEHLHRALRPGGLLFARIQVEDAGTHPQHIVRDFEPTFVRMQELGFVETWRDTWLWGHRLFEKRSA